MAPAHKLYSQSLKDLDLGEAQYHPDGFGMRPGHCGYFNENGAWKNILDITAIDPQDAAFKPLSKLQTIQATVAPQQWGPMYGGTVECCGTKAIAAIEVPGAPVSAGLSFEFEKTANYGAVLLTAPVTHSAFPHKQPFHQWCKDNAPALVSSADYGEEVKRHGLFIITEVYSTPRCAIIQWQGETKNVSVSVSVNALNGGKLTGSGFWGKSTISGSWRGFPQDEVEQPAIKSLFSYFLGAEASDPPSYTIFVGGLEYKFSRLGAMVNPERPLHTVRRGPDDIEQEDFPVDVYGLRYQGQLRSLTNLRVPSSIPHPFERDLAELEPAGVVPEE